MRFTRLILALTSFLILITQTDLFASTVLHKTSMVDLSNNAIICMHQDPDGYLWIGTYDGLNLYNGKDTYVYRFELNNKNSLCSNIIHKISDAEPGFLWISTSLGINKFSLKERKVTESFPGYMECDLLASDSSGITLAICKENRISCYTPSSDGFRDLPREGVGKFQQGRIAVERLLCQIQGDRRPTADLLQPELVVRSTCAPRTQGGRTL